MTDFQDQIRTIPGEDKFGKFTIMLRIHECDCCGHSVLSTIHYREKPKLPDGIDADTTILHNPLRMWMGIDCGCYAKFHRQVAHIQTRMQN